MKIFMCGFPPESLVELVKKSTYKNLPFYYDFLAYLVSNSFFV